MLYLFLVHSFLYTQVFCQTPQVEGDTRKFGQNLNSPSDSLEQNAPPLQTNVDTVDIAFAEGDIDGPIDYHATDSIVYDLKNQKLYLYGAAYMKYTDIEIESGQIEYDWETSTLTARGEIDSLDNLVSYAKFTEKSGEYEADSMQYNFKTGKGRTYDVVTEQEGAYIHSEIVQKNEFDEWYGFKTKYTTCTNKEHPHFYLGAKKSKVVPDKVMVTGPVNLVVADVNTPLYLPFGIFPTKTGRKSGIIMPTYGEQPSLGFFLKDGGYFWAVNDHLSLAFLGEVYTRGRFGVSVNANYKKIYKYSGSLFLKYFRTPPNDRFLSSDGLNNDFSIAWSHTMDGKARPNNTFSANIDGQTSGYNSNSLQTDQQLLTVQVNSNINYTRRLSKINSSFQVSARHNQNLSNNTISITLPELSFNASRFTPFQRKIKSEKKAFYETIGFQYTARAKATISTVDSILFTQESLDDLQYGISQTAVVDAPFNLFKYFVVRPTMTYNERWYFERESKLFVGDSIDIGGEELEYRETIDNFQRGFFGVRDFSIGTSVSTTLTGIYNFKAKRLKAIRHVIKPSVSYSFRPDFGKERWGYVDTYTNSETMEETQYNRYQSSSNLYGVAQSGLQNAVAFNLRSNLEMKVVDRKDSMQNLKKVPLLEQFNATFTYDFTADSLKMSALRLSAQSSLFKNLITWNAGVVLDPYAINDKRVRVNKTFFSENKRLLRIDNAYASVNLNLTGKSKDGGQKKMEYGTIDERQYIANNPQMFYDFNVPWSLTVGYRLNITKGVVGNVDSTVVTANSITFGGHLNITPKWQINVTSGYDIRNKDLTLTNVRVERDLHCWVLAFNWTAYPLNRQTYAIDLHVKSQILQELKLSRKQPAGSIIDVF